MTTLQAHGHFINAGPDSELMQIDPPWLYAAYCTAFASLSGMLAEIGNYDDLRDAVRHGQSLAIANVVSDADVLAEVKEVVGEVFRWAEAAAALN